MMESAALIHLGRWLQGNEYRFVTISPASHARVLARDPRRTARTLTDVFGWSLPFRRDLLPIDVIATLEEADALEVTEDLLRSKIRFSTLGRNLYVHSAFPTQQADAVFFGPDTYRFAALIRRTLRNLPDMQVCRIADIGAGTGAGVIVAADALDKRSAAPEMIATDINPLALSFAQVNAALADVTLKTCEGDLYVAFEGKADLIIANPPYLRDAAERAYRHGGGPLGTALSVRIVREGLERLAPGGALVLYTAAPIVEGRDTLFDEIVPIVRNAGLSFEYEEIDPDVFGEELDNPAYRRVDRLAVVSLVIRGPAGTPALGDEVLLQAMPLEELA